MSNLLDFQALYDASPYPFLVLSTDFVILSANRAYLKAVGNRELVDLVGKLAFDAFPPNPDEPENTREQQIRDSLQQVLDTKRPHSTMPLRYGVKENSARVSRFSNQLWSIVHTPVLDSKGDVSFILQSPTDVSGLLWTGSDGAPVLEDASIGEVVENTQDARMYASMVNALAAERTRLMDLFNQAPGFLAITRGPNHVFELANDAYYQLVGHREIIGKTVFEALPDLAGQGFEELLDSIYQKGEQFFGRGMPLLVQENPNGPVVEKRIDLLYLPVRSRDGSISGTFTQGHDVTAVYAAEQKSLAHVAELQRIQRRQAFQLELSDLIRKSSAEVKIFAAGGELLQKYLQSSCVLFGDYDVESSTVDYLACVSDGSVPNISDNCSLAMPGGAGIQPLEEMRTLVFNDAAGVPGTGTCSDTTRETLEVRSAIAVPAQRNGKRIACLLVGSSVPRSWTADEIQAVEEAADRIWTGVERVRAVQALQDSNRHKDEFLAMLAHELRNPIAPISVAAELLQMPKFDSARIAPTGALIGRQIRHMRGLIDDLLDVSRASGGLVVLERERLDIRLALQDAVEQVSPLALDRGQTLSVLLPEAPSIVIGDFKRLVQIFANLLVNAVKFTPATGKITLAVSCTDKNATVSVTDNGTGIDKSLLPYVFDLFRQGKRDAARSQGGLGLGLALVNSLTSLHGGTVEAHSSGLGLGSKFVVTLPIVPPAPTDLSDTHHPESDRSASRPLCVLVVDDNVDAAFALGEFLTAAGHHAIIEHNAFDAFERATNVALDACLLDIGLPGMDGNELARRIRGSNRNQAVALVAITGYGQAESKAIAKSAGFDRYLVKPANPTEILKLLSELVPS